KVRLFRYEQWIPAKWTDLHALFQMACSAQLERNPVGVLADGGLTTIEQEYLRVLVLQLMNSGNLTPRHLEWVAEQLSEWCAPLRLTLESSTVTSFYVDLGARTGLKRRAPQPLEGRVLFLDTRPLHAVLMQNVVMLDQKVRNNPLSDRTPRRADQLNLLSKLASQVDPEFKPFARRGERTSAEGSVDAIIGFARIAGFLHEEDAEPFIAGRRTTERAEIGLQVIANNLIGVELTEAKKDDPEVLIGGDVSTLSKHRFNGLFLSLRKRDGETAVQTLVVPPGEYQPGKRLYMSAAQSSQRIAFGRVLEQHPDWVWATVEPLL